MAPQQNTEDGLELRRSARIHEQDKTLWHLMMTVDILLDGQRCRPAIAEHDSGAHMSSMSRELARDLGFDLFNAEPIDASISANESSFPCYAYLKFQIGVEDQWSVRRPRWLTFKICDLKSEIRQRYSAGNWLDKGRAASCRLAKGTWEWPIKTIPVSLSHEQPYIPITIGLPRETITINALFVSGCSHSTISQEFANHHDVSFAHGGPCRPPATGINCSEIYRFGEVALDVIIQDSRGIPNSHIFTFDASISANQVLVIGHDWMRQFQPDVNWVDGTFTWPIDVAQRARRRQPYMDGDGQPPKHAIEAIRDHERTDQGMCYSVKWTGFPNSDNSGLWEWDMVHARKLMQEYHGRLRDEEASER